jgi:hypothetical protein
VLNVNCYYLQSLIWLLATNQQIYKEIIILLSQHHTFSIGTYDFQNIIKLLECNVWVVVM